MTDIQAALGIHQLRKLPEFHRRRKEIAEHYNRAFSKIEELQVPVERDWAGHAWHLYALRLNLGRLTISRDQFIAELQRRNIGSSVHFIPVHLHSHYREKYKFRAEDFPVAYAEYQRLVSLPCSPRLSDEDIEDVIAAVSTVVQQNSLTAGQRLAAACP